MGKTGTVRAGSAEDGGRAFERVDKRDFERVNRRDFERVDRRDFERVDRPSDSPPEALVRFLQLASEHADLVRGLPGSVTK